VVVSALDVLVEVLLNEPETLRGHLKAIITGAVKVHRECSEATPSRGDGAHAVMCRKLALQLLGALPKKFEERHLLPYSLQLQRTLGVACGDRVREVRKVALIARENWSKVV